MKNKFTAGFHLALYGNELYTKAERYVVSGSHSLRLDGTNYVQAPHALMSSEQLTVCLWMYWTGGSAGAGQRIFDFGTDGDNCLYLTPSDGSHMRFAICKGGEEQTLLASKFPSLKMKHVALTIASDSVTLYIDGERVAATADINLRPSDIRPVLGYIGRSQQGSHPLLKAYIDDLRFYNYALTSAEIQQVMTDIDTGIVPLENTSGALDMGTSFDLQGRPFSHEVSSSSLSHEIYIKNGKKYLIR